MHRPASTVPAHGAGGDGGDEALRALGGNALDRRRVGGTADLRLLLARLAHPRPDVLRRGRRALVGGVRHDLDPLPADRAASVANDRRPAGSRRADRRRAAGGRDHPAGSGGCLRRGRARAPRTSPGRPAVGQLHPVLDPRGRRPSVRRQLLRARISGREQALRPLRIPASGGIDRPHVVRAGGRDRDRERADGGRAGDRRRTRSQPDRGAPRLRGTGAAPPGRGLGTSGRRHATHPGARRWVRRCRWAAWAGCPAVGSPPQCS